MHLSPIALAVLLAMHASAPVLAATKPPSTQQAIEGFKRATALPKWAQPLAEVPASSRDESVVIRLSETQAWAGPGPAYLVNKATQVNDTKMLGTIGQFTIDYFAAYQKLTLHRVVILRGAERIDRTMSVNVRPLQRETQMEIGMLGGATTLQLLLDDVRVGDTLLTTYTVEGENPVFGSTWTNEFSWDLDNPIEHRRLIVLHPASRPLRWQQLGDSQSAALTPQITAAGGIVQMRFDGRAIEAIEHEPFTPPDYLPGRMLQFSEYPSWQDVARWADGLFRKHAAHQDVKQLARQFAVLPTEAERASAALRWVQEEVRYFSVSLGQNSHRPQMPDVVIKRRYGDCKDKSYLLVTLLAELGIEAKALLVNATAPSFPAKTMASPAFFNHVIVRIDIDGKQYHVDPTRIGQPEPLAQLPAALPGAAALLVDPAATALITLPDPRPALPQHEKIHAISVVNTDGDATLEALEIYRGDYADRARLEFATMPAKELGKSVLADVEKRYPGVSLGAPPVVQDISAENRYEVRSKFKLPKAMLLKDEYYSVAYEHKMLDNSLHIPDKVVRQFPLALPSGGYHGRYRLTIQWPAAMLAIKPSYVRGMDNPWFAIKSEFTFRGSRTEYLLDYRIKTKTVAAADVPALQGAAKELDTFSGGSFRASTDNLITELGSKFSVRDIELARLTNYLVSVQARKQADLSLEERCAAAYTGQALQGLTYAEFTRYAATLESAIEARKAQPDDALCLARLAFGRGEFINSLALYKPHETRIAAYSGDMRNLAWAQLYAGSPQAAAIAMQSYRDGRLKQADQYHEALEQADETALLQRAGKALQAEPQQYSGTWPQPLLAMQAGQLAPDALIKTAEAMAPAVAPQALTEALFYVGQKHLAAGNESAAHDAFRRLLAEGMRSNPLYRQARAELGRAPAQSAAFESGMQALKANKLVLARSHFAAGADSGIAGAQLMLGGMLIAGEGGPAAPEQGLAWLRKAAEQRLPMAELGLWHALREGHAGPADSSQAMVYLKRAAEGGLPAAMAELGDAFWDGAGTPVDFTQAAYWYARAAAGGHGGAAVALAVAQEEGRGIPQDLAASMKTLQELADAGLSAAQYHVARRYADGTGVGKDEKLAARWYRKASDQGYLRAHTQLGRMFAESRGVPRSMDEAIKLFRMAADQGELGAMEQLGYHYNQDGNGHYDPAAAVLWSGRAAEKGSSLAAYNLGVYLYYGHGVPVDHAKGLAALTKAAEAGESGAWLHIGIAYLDGNGVAYDGFKAKAAFEKGAALGDKQAMFKLADCLTEGWTGVIDLPRAATLYRQAAEGGNAYAAFKAAQVAEYGLGTPQSDADAGHWYEIAAQGGNVQARFHLYVMQEFGRLKGKAPSAARDWLPRDDTLDSPEQHFGIALVYMRNKQYAQAEARVAQGITLWTSKKRDNQQAMIDALDELAAMHVKRGSPSHAQPHLERAVLAAENSTGLQTAQAQRLLGKLGTAHELQGDDAGALVQFQRAIDAVTAQHGPNSRSLIRYLGLAGLAHERMGQWKQAEAVWQRCVALAKSAGPQAHAVATAQNNLGLFYVKRERFAEAEVHLTEALALREKLFGKEHPETLISVHNLGRWQARQRHYGPAMETFTRAIKIAEQFSMEKDLADIKTDLGIMLAEQGNLAAAEPYLQDAVTVHQRDGAQLRELQLARKALADVHRRSGRAASPD